MEQLNPHASPHYFEMKKIIAFLFALSSLRTLLADMAQDRIILVATHVVSDVESVATKVILLRAGKIVDAAPVPDLIEKHAPGGGLEDVYLNVFGEGDGK